jgi:site-specific recombinase XerD
LHPKKYSDGTRPVMVRVIKDKTVYKTICKVPDKDWDSKNKKVKRSHSSYINLNALISEEFQKYEKRYFDLLAKNKNFKAFDVFEDEKLNDENLVSAFDRYLVHISQNLELSTIEKYRSFYYFLQSCFNTENVTDIDDGLVMKIVGKLKANGNNQNSIFRRISFFKSFVKWANKEFNLRIDVENPAKKHKSKKEKLTVEEITLLAQFDLSKFGKKIQIARDIFLMQYYLYGSRVSDVLRLRLDDIKPDRINIVQHKTKAIVSVKLSQSIKDIIDFEPAPFLQSLNQYFDKGMNAFIFCNKDLVPDYLNWALKEKYAFNILFWKKPNALPLGGQHRPDVEYILYFRKNAIWNNALSDVNYSKCLEFGRDDSTKHPTMKPLDLIINEIKIASNKESIVVDPFGGSGSTLIACEKLKRKCRMIELDPKYCDVIIERWERLTGLTATRLEQ